MNKIYYGGFAVFAFLIILSGSLFSVDQRQNGVVFQFGEAVRVIETPGLNIKIPFIQNVQFFDKRVLDVKAEAKELTASDEKRVIVDAFAKFRIVNTVQFIKTVHNYQGAQLRLNRILESAMRTVIGKFPLNTLLTDKRANLMLQIRDLTYSEAKNFGVEVIDVRILKADLPPENSTAIYMRMQTDREKEANQIRAEGNEEAARIRSKADKESKIILANAYMDAQKAKGLGDAESARLYNQAYSKDPEFFKFYASLNAYKTSLTKENTQFVLSPDSEFFKYLKLGK
ncbi:MAG: protease modulator HflC [Rickettsiaceae bacterium]|jgi:membrane protease subunit HflC|nr:protease modulator HflC [Alphaproteobacteria bacterium]MBN8522279.1 protease modulator HflC [Rickettsiales bacterium]MCP5362401.1 protease modulator HflC [Rickettsiaceae bacterium]MCP5374566.1 protease modulator HflC [Rickettsiaceae bacterium]MCP5378170.1 protease modulator HflC [Rickettsiaceae bacterium]